MTTSTTTQVEANARDTAAARALYQQFVDLIRDDFIALPSDAARVKFLKFLSEKVGSSLAKLEPPSTPTVKQQSPCAANARTRSEDGDGDVFEAIGIAVEIRDLSEVVDWPDAADVAAKASDIAENIERCGRVTDAQMSSLENMLRGMQAWVRD